MKHLNLTEPLYDYMLNVSLREHPILQALREKTATHPLAVMQIPPEQAQFMQLLLRLIKAQKVLELGTFTGYSTLAMALSLPKEGQIITCDVNSEWTDIGQPFWAKAQQQEKIELRLGKALDTLEQLLSEDKSHHSFDFIFIDADKTNYVSYYEASLKLIRPGGLIAIDNVFWEGKVLDDAETGGQVREIRKLNALIREDDRVFVSLLPIADGLLLLQAPE